jgi:hypothetical protein
VEQGPSLDLIAAQSRRTLFGALVDACAAHNGTTTIVEDQDRRPLSYADLIRAAFALGRPLGRMTSPREHVGVLLPTSVGVSDYGVRPAGDGTDPGDAQFHRWRPQYPVRLWRSCSQTYHLLAPVHRPDAARAWCARPRPACSCPPTPSSTSTPVPPRPGEAVRGALKSRMINDFANPLALEEYLPAIVEGAQKIGAGPERGCRRSSRFASRPIRHDRILSRRRPQSLLDAQVLAVPAPDGRAGSFRNTPCGKARAAAAQERLCRRSRRTHRGNRAA